MKKFLKVVLLLGFATGALFALSADECIINNYRGNDLIDPVCSTRTLAVLDIYISGGYNEVHNAVTIYITGGSTTSAATYRVWADSVAFVTTGGLYPGTTHWIFANADEDTIEEAVIYWNAIATTTAGVEGGITISTVTNGIRPSTQLTATSAAATCLGASAVATLTATPSCTAVCIISASSATFRTTGGLYAGSTYWSYIYANQDTLGEAVTYWNAVSTKTKGIEGGITMVLRANAYEGNVSSSMTVRVSADIHTSTNTTTFFTDAIVGLKYTIPATEYKRNFLTYCNANMTFASGNTYISVFDGADNTDTTLLDKTKIKTSAESYPLPIYGEGSYIMGSKNTAMHIQIVNESGIVISANILNIRSAVK